MKNLPLRDIADARKSAIPWSNPFEVPRQWIRIILPNRTAEFKAFALSLGGEIDADLLAVGGGEDEVLHRAGAVAGIGCGNLSRVQTR